MSWVRKSLLLQIMDVAWKKNKIIPVREKAREKEKKGEKKYLTAPHEDGN